MAGPSGQLKDLLEFGLADVHSAEVVARLAGIIRARKADPLAAACVRAIHELSIELGGRPSLELSIEGGCWASTLRPGDLVRPD